MRCTLVLCQGVETKSHIHLETVTGEIFSKKEVIVFCICIFGESIQSLA